MMKSKSNAARIAVFGDFLAGGVEGGGGTETGVSDREAASSASGGGGTTGSGAGSGGVTGPVAALAASFICFCAVSRISSAIDINSLTFSLC